MEHVEHFRSLLSVPSSHLNEKHTNNKIKKHTNIQPGKSIIINLFIEGSVISAKALFCLRALFGATRIHSYTRMASLIRTRLSDLCTR